MSHETRGWKTRALGNAYELIVQILIEAGEHGQMKLGHLEQLGIAAKEGLRLAELTANGRDLGDLGAECFAVGKAANAWGGIARKLEDAHPRGLRAGPRRRG